MYSWIWKHLGPQVVHCDQFEHGAVRICSSPGGDLNIRLIEDLFHHPFANTQQLQYQKQRGDLLRIAFPGSWLFTRRHCSHFFLGDSKKDNKTKKKAESRHSLVNPKRQCHTNTYNTQECQCQMAWRAAVAGVVRGAVVKKGREKL